jgi:ribosomal protein L35AE/L33A
MDKKAHAGEERAIRGNIVALVHGGSGVRVYKCRKSLDANESTGTVRQLLSNPGYSI